MRPLFASLFGALLLAACAGTPFSYDSARKVKVGMTEQEITEIMGPPYSVTSRGDTQIWVWSEANGFTGSHQAVSFVMKDGKVAGVPTIPASFK